MPVSSRRLAAPGFTSGPGASALPMVVFAATRLGATPEIYALATVIVLVVAALLPGAALVQRWSRRSA